jgi:hypothetical protein
MIKSISIKALILATLLIAAPSISFANDFTVDAHLKSYHTDRDLEFKEDNPGLLVRYQKETNWYYVVGGYQNSEDYFSFLAGGGYMFGKGFLKSSVSIGLVSGYDYAPVVPMILGSIHIGIVNFHFVPDISNDQIVISCSLKLMTF